MTDPTETASQKIIWRFTDSHYNLDFDTISHLADLACSALGIDPDGIDPHAAAVAAEREAIAELVDARCEMEGLDGLHLHELAAAIRARGDNDD